MTEIFQISRKGASQFRRAIIDPVNITMLLLLAVLAYLVVWPFVQLLIETLTWGQGDRRISRQAVPGKFTWFHWLQAGCLRRLPTHVVRSSVPHPNLISISILPDVLICPQPTNLSLGIVTCPHLP